MPVKNENEQRKNGLTRDDVIRDTKAYAQRELVGGEDWKKSKVGAALGIFALSRAARAAFSAISEPATKTWKAGREFFSHWTVEPLQTDSNDPARRFEVARIQHGRDEADIRMDINTTCRWFSIFFILTALTFAYGIASMGWVGRSQSQISW